MRRRLTYRSKQFALRRIIRKQITPHRLSESTALKWLIFCAAESHVHTFLSPPTTPILLIFDYILSFLLIHRCDAANIIGFYGIPHKNSAKIMPDYHHIERSQYIKAPPLIDRLDTSQHLTPGSCNNYQPNCIYQISSPEPVVYNQHPIDFNCIKKLINLSELRFKGAFFWLPFVSSLSKRFPPDRSTTNVYTGDKQKKKLQIKEPKQW